MPNREGTRETSEPALPPWVAGARPGPATASAAPASGLGSAAGSEAAARSGSGTDEPTRVTPDGRVPAAQADLAQVQALLPGYELEAELHRGGQGVVYRAVQLGTRRRVALKVLLEGPFAGENARRRFEREVELAASLHHRNIVTILDSGISHGRYYFAMELIEGLRLDQYLRANSPPLPQTLRLLARICEAVNFAHQRGVIHRDLKPSNILVDADGEPHVLDFGLAKAERTADARQSTVAVLSSTGQVLGTLAYMSPEQAAGTQDVDVRSDVYSLGVIFYEALLGRTPYVVSGALGDVLQRIARDDPVRPRSLRSASRFGRLIDDELETILLKALEKDPARRYQTAGDLGRDLVRYICGEPIEAKRASGLYMLRKTLRRYRWQALTAAGVLVMLVVFLGVFVDLYQRERAARATAAVLLDRANERSQAARRAESAERDARRESEAASRRALDAAERLRRTLVRQKVQRGSLAMAQNDLAEARESFWEAFDERSDDPAARWALRNYYFESGDEHADLLALRREGPIALSSGGTVAALCQSPRSVTVVDAARGEMLDWFPTPRGVLALHVRDDGFVAAAGWNWLRLWRVGRSTPLAAIELGGLIEPLAVYLPDGPGGGLPRILVVDSQRVSSYDAETGRVLGRASVQHAAGDARACDEAAGRLALRSGATVELVSIRGDGQLESEIVWRQSTAAAAAALEFTRDGRLALLAEAVYVAQVEDARRGAWVGVGPVSGRWEHLAVSPTGVVAVASRDGRVALLRDGKQVDAWRITRRALERVQWSRDGLGLLTLDDGAALTRWRRPPDAGRPRAILSEPAVAAAFSADGLTSALMDSAGVVLTHSYRGPTLASTRRRLSAGLGRLLTGVKPQDASLSLSDDGALLAMRLQDRVWIERRGRTRQIGWSHPAAPALRDVALSGDGSVLALFSESPAGDRQLVQFLHAGRRTTSAPFQQAPAAPPVSFEGSALRQIAFIPGSRELLVARSSGALLRLRPDVSDAVPGDVAHGPGIDAPEPWTTLESPPTRIAFDRAGRLLAAACEDGVVRVLALTDAAEVAHLPVGAPITAVAFGEEPSTLLVRTAEPAARLYDLAAADPIAAWSFAAAEGDAIAAFVGRDDGLLLLGRDGGVYLHDYRAADRRIESNRVLAARREISRALASGKLDDAWNEIERVAPADPGGAFAARCDLAEAQLRRGASSAAAEAWITSLLASDRRAALARLGIAAYESGRFELAARLLGRAREAAGGDGALDAYAAWRLAECTYLISDPASAVTELTRVSGRRDLDPRDLARVQLERVAALCLADRWAEAEGVLREIERGAGDRERATTIDVMAAVAIGNYLLGRQEENQAMMIFEQFLATFRENWLTYRDDVEFFMGELARRRGDLPAARTRYQRCIDVARDAWPANWARFRLAQLAGEPG